MNWSSYTLRNPQENVTASSSGLRQPSRNKLHKLGSNSCSACQDVHRHANSSVTNVQLIEFVIHFGDQYKSSSLPSINPLKPELNPICYLLALLGADHFLHVSRIRVKLLTLR